jgi:hypothetical protein
MYFFFGTTNSLIVTFITDKIKTLEENVKPRSGQVQIKLEFPEISFGSTNFCYPASDEVHVTGRWPANSLFPSIDGS